jgi:hypothetical protein
MVFEMLGEICKPDKETIPDVFYQHSPTPENPTPLPSYFQMYQNVFIDFGRGQKAEGYISGVLFHDPALYYEVTVRVVNKEFEDGSCDERYVLIEVPAGIVFAYPESGSAK